MWSQSAELSSTIGTERLTYALQIKKPRGVHPSAHNKSASPAEYFLEDAAINRAGAPSLGVSGARSIPATELKSMLGRGAIVLDVRPVEQFAAGHVPGSIELGSRVSSLPGLEPSWELPAQPVIIGGTPEQLSEARMRLARVGIENVRGYLDGGIEG